MTFGARRSYLRNPEQSMGVGRCALAFGVILAGCGTRQAAPQPRAEPTGMRDTDLVLTPALAERCRNASTSEQHVSCVQDIVTGLAETGSAFSGMQEGTGGCMKRDDVEETLKAIADRSSKYLSGIDRPAVIIESNVARVLLRTAPGKDEKAPRAYRLRIEAIGKSPDPACRYGAVQWNAFAIEERADHSVVIRSDDIAGELQKIVTTQLKRLE